MLEWQKEIAIRNGVPPRLVERLSEAFNHAPVGNSSTDGWVNWLLDIVAEYPLDLTIFVKETALISVFGRAYTNTSNPEATAKRILEALKVLVSKWCRGCTLAQIEEWLLEFIRKHEENVSQQANQSSTAQHARRFAIRIAPDIGFLCGLLGQISAYKVAEEDGIMPPLIEMLPQMVRTGDYDLHHTALRQMSTHPSRVELFEMLFELNLPSIANAYATMDVVREEVTSAVMLKSFTALVDKQ
ncbi:hypothetical protein HZS80_02410 [Halomonas glaciei]|uniref:Uncharacterized protein n=1 Tax=Vreelandella glaciei TaxID=186761 RepID=A0A7Z0LQE3_9GAMM|nr:hypothetical protein [Halomonas glaciei]NYS76588.1 hypothetical protein [Halomonas glaciei]